ncbi:hypothetical protein RJT34_13810 [Clitoria ternatea]|uniref:Uncharacterized protein n=1 Tax=Clitoria ternatea TaxID=43366 RepID=A0AAN9PM58_CLITE
MPVTTSKLQLLSKSKHIYVEKNLNALVNIIRHSIQKAAEFEEVTDLLKEGVPPADTEKFAQTRRYPVTETERSNNWDEVHRCFMPAVYSPYSVIYRVVR